MSEAVGNLRANLTADWADFRSELQRSAGAVDNFAKGFQQAAGRIARDALGVFGGIQIGRFVSDSIHAAQEAQETAGAFRAAFGDQADAAEEWASRTHDAFRLTEAETQSLATRFQNLFGEIAPTNEAAAETSQRFTELARDFAELKNISVDQAVDRITSALAGSARAMRQYGIDLSETAVRQEALAQGIITADQELSNEQSTLVRASILMRELGDATGETARQSGDAEAEAQRLTQEYQEQSQQLGDALLPAMTALKGTLADLLQGFTDAARGVGRFIERNDVLLAQAYQIRQALRGQFISFNEALAGVAMYRASADDAAPAVAGLGAEIRGTTDDSAAFSAQLAEQARALQDGGTRGRSGGRSWADRHENDLRRIMEGYDQVGAALREYNEDVEIARRGGLDMAQAQRALAQQFIDNVGGVRMLAGSLEDLPEPIRLLAEELLPKLEQEAGTAEDRFRAFAQALNEDFGEEKVTADLAQIQRALDEGLITMETYIRAKNDLLGGDQDAGIFPDTTADEERFQMVEDRISSIREGLADLATGTSKFGDVWKEVVLEFLRSQWIEPFLERLIRLANGAGSGGVKGAGVLSSGGSILGSILGSVFGGKREGGGDVRRGMAYEVGERGRELFIPDQDGHIAASGSYGRGGVTMNIYTPDANSFRASRRQIARTERRRVGAE